MVLKQLVKIWGRRGNNYFKAFTKNELDPYSTTFTI